jgi:hypothetical protein
LSRWVCSQSPSPKERRSPPRSTSSSTQSSSSQRRPHAWVPLSATSKLARKSSDKTSSWLSISWYP